MKVLSLLLVVFSLLTGTHAYSQKPIKVQGISRYEANDNETTADAERKALEHAKISAIEKAFGMNATETSSGITSNKFEENHFTALSQTSIRGEWIETIGEPKYEYDFNDRRPVITCTVEGLVKEITGIRTDYETKILKLSPNEKFESTDFEDGDPMYLYFKSPIGGYLNVFLLCPEDDTALCLLPYRNSTEGTFKVEPDTEYFLFSKDKATSNPDIVDEYNLSTDRPTEFNDVIIIFSTDNFVKANLKIKSDDITAIKETSIAKFNSWMAKLQTKHNNVTPKTIPIKISNK